MVVVVVMMMMVLMVMITIRIRIMVIMMMVVVVMITMMMTTTTTTMKIIILNMEDRATVDDNDAHGGDNNITKKIGKLAAALREKMFYVLGSGLTKTINRSHGK